MGEPISRSLPALLADLLERPGPRPAVDRRHPCPQLTEVAPDGLVAALLRRARSLPGVELAEPRVTTPGGTGLALAAAWALGQEEAFVMGDQFAILRGPGDGSLHLMLYPEWEAHVLRLGWGQIHPLGLLGLIPPQHLIAYAPRDEAELEAVWRILCASYCHARGELVDLP